MTRGTREIMADLAATGLSPEQIVLVVELTAAIASEPKGKSAGAERTRRWRDRKPAPKSVTSDVTVTPCDAPPDSVTVTSQASQSVTCDTPHIDTSSFSFKDPDRKEVKKKESKSHGIRLPADWRPDIDFAIGKGMQIGRVHSEAEKFRNYWAAKPGKDGTKSDWPATWRNWIINSLERNPAKPRDDDNQYLAGRL